MFEYFFAEHISDTGFIIRIKCKREETSVACNMIAKAMGVDEPRQLTPPIINFHLTKRDTFDEPL